MSTPASAVFSDGRVEQRSWRSRAAHNAQQRARTLQEALVLSGRPADPRSRRAASIAIALSALLFIILVPFAKVPLAAYPLFVPVNQTVLIVNDLVTAMLLLAQLRVTGSRALLVLACAYVYAALMALVHLLTFPGVFAPGGLLGGGAQTTGYLFVFWHGGFVLFAMGYTFLKKREPAVAAPQMPALAGGLALVVCAVAALTLLATAGNDLFPPMLEDGRYTSAFNVGRFGQWVLAAAAMVYLWRSKPHSVLDQWLLVVLFTWFIEIALVGIFNAGRYDLGFYAGRVYGLLASCCVLGLLLWEQARMYSGLLAARETARSEAELREHRGVLRLAMEGGRMGAWSSDLSQGRLWWSTELETILGLRPGAFKGTLRDALRRIRRDDVRLIRDAIGRALARQEDFSLEVCVRHASDGWRWMAIRGQAVADGEGRLTSLFGIAMDITERRRSEQAARQVEARFRMLADGIPQLAWMARPDGWIYWFNRRWHDYTGKTPAEVEGWGWQCVHDPEVLPAVMEAWRRSIASGDNLEMVFPLRGADGQYRSFLTRATPFKDADGHVVHWFGTNTDITAQRELEQALRTADRLKDEFLATLAHELRNPLAPIRNAVTLVKCLPPQPPEVQRAWNIVDRQSMHLSRLVEDLLEASRITQGKLRLRSERMSILEALQDAVEATRPALEAAGHQLVLQLSDDCLYADADPTRITQVFVNLLNNAAKFTPPGGTVRVSADREGSFARIAVRDNGIGIPPEHLDGIFGIFSQVTRALERSQGGLGIGLALVRGLVELHGGTVQAHSAGEGQGTEFTVRLPLAPDA